MSFGPQQSPVDGGPSYFHPGTDRCPPLELATGADRTDPACFGAGDVGLGGFDDDFHYRLPGSDPRGSAVSFAWTEMTTPRAALVLRIRWPPRTARLCATPSSTWLRRSLFRGLGVSLLLAVRLDIADHAGVLAGRDEPAGGVPQPRSSWATSGFGVRTPGMSVRSVGRRGMGRGLGSGMAVNLSPADTACHSADPLASLHEILAHPTAERGDDEKYGDHGRTCGARDRRGVGYRRGDLDRVGPCRCVSAVRWTLC